MKKFLTAAVAMLSCLNFACASADNVKVEVPQSLSKSVDEFSWKYMATLIQDENIFYSPYGMTAALGMLANGATGETLRELLTATESESVDVLNDGHKKFAELVKQNYGDENIFMESNLLLIDKKFAERGLNKDYRSIVTDVYKSEVRKADFAGNIDGEKKKITEWVKDKTSGFIPNYKAIANEATITDLLNVVYFKGTWAIPFDESQTTAQEFTNRDGQKTFTDMMNKNFRNEIAYVEDKTFKAIKLPYSKNAAMYVIMPTDDNLLNPSELWIAESKEYRAEFLKKLDNAWGFDGEVVVRLPKFELDIENALEEHFKAMGIVKSFSDDAEYFNIVNDTRLKIGSAKHRAKVKVDEQGTKAAAVTEISMVETTAAPSFDEPKIVYFYADRPFLFLIRDTNSDVTLFTGVVNYF
ncbi:MAG: hypothetical protein K6G55_02965 [Selenomonadaceae bacterium]|nr:hypothetical protein [Selenomonadaceae bacterium]